jgi:hypothetical protein
MFKDQMLSLYAALSAFAGWLSYDLCNFAAATNFLETARSAAHEAHNTPLGAHVLCNMSQIATWRGQPRTGIDHAVAAQGWAAQTDDLRLQAYAQDVAARAYAADGAQRDALGAIERARTMHARADPDQPTTVYSCTPADLTSTESNCHLQLGDARRAAECAEIAMSSIDQSFVRDRAMTALRLSASRLKLERPDVAGAAVSIGEAIPLAAHNRSQRLAIELQRGLRAFEPWRDVAEVDNVRELVVSYGLT